MMLLEWAQRWGLSQQAFDELHAVLNEPTTAVTGGEATSEGATQALCRLEAPKRGAWLGRNNSGAGDMVDRHGNLSHVRWGLGNDSSKLNKVSKSSDLIGITPVRSTHVGQMFGVLTAVECKHPGWTKPENERDRAQENFHKMVRRLGGIGIFAASVDDYKRIFTQ